MSATGAKSGVVSLAALSHYVLTDQAGVSLRGDSPAGREYGQQARAVVASLPEEPGFYVWGTYDANGRWRSIYVGMVGYGKTTDLRERNWSLLKDEKHCLWRGVQSDDALMALGQRYYSDQWPQYRSRWIRALDKAGTTHIVWVSAAGLGLDTTGIREVDAHLIETLNPSANQVRPRPNGTKRPIVHAVIGSFLGEIDAHRPISSVVR